MTSPQQPLPNANLSEQGLRELEVWLEKKLLWTPWVYFGTYPDDLNSTPRSPAFQNNWQNSGGGKQRLRFRRTVPHKGQLINSLEIEGQIAGGDVDSIVGTLPETFRPKETALLEGPTDEPGVAVWRLDTNGDLTFLGTVGGSGVTFGLPALTLGTAAATGSIDEAIRRDSTVIAFDATVPTTQAFGDAAATGSAAVAARRDHKHAMPANPVSYATPAVALGSSAAAGAASTVIRSDSTIAAFDATVPSTQAFGDAAATGSAAFAARRDHKHAMPATPVTTINKTGSTALTGAVTLTGGTNVTLTQSGQDISIAATGGGTSQHILLADGHATPFAFTDLLQMDDGSDFMWND